MKQLTVIIGRGSSFVKCRLPKYLLSLFRIQKRNKTLEISKLHVNVDVVGNMATTTFDIVFYNPIVRNLEGELSMPLANGQEICRYALEVNGKTERRCYC